MLDGVGYEVRKRLTCHVRSELRARVTVEELRHRWRRGDRLEHLLLQRGEDRLVDILRRSDHARVFRQVRLLRVGGAKVVEELLGGVGILRRLGHHPAVDRRLDRLGAEIGVHFRPGEEVEVGGVALGERLADEVADGHHAGFFVHEGGRGLLPVPTIGVLLVERQETCPLREDVLHAVVGPALLAGHQVHVELVAIHAEVELIERTHRRPPAVIAERERDNALVLHVRRQRLQLIVGRRRVHSFSLKRLGR